MFGVDQNLQLDVHDLQKESCISKAIHRLLNSEREFKIFLWALPPLNVNVIYKVLICFVLCFFLLSISVNTS